MILIFRNEFNSRIVAQGVGSIYVGTPDGNLYNLQADDAKGFKRTISSTIPSQAQRSNGCGMNSTYNIDFQYTYGWERP